MPEQEDQAAFAALSVFASELERKQLDGRMKKQARIWKPTATSATQLGYECERRIVYQRAMPWAAEQISPELASIFEEGNLHERQVVQELENDLGIKLRERQSTFRDERLDIVGVTDFDMLVDGIGWVPTEVKGLTGVPGEDTGEEDMAEGSDLLRRYASQLQTYLFLKSKPLGMFIIKSKMTGRWRCIPVRLNYERVEVILRRAERVRDAYRTFVKVFSSVMPFTQDGPPMEDRTGLHVAVQWDLALAAAETMLPERQTTRAECARCPFKKRCNPSQVPVDPALLIDDEDLIGILNRREATREARQTYEKNHKWLKERFENVGGSVWFAGKHRIERKPHGKFTKLIVTNQEVRNANDEE